MEKMEGLLRNLKLSEAESKGIKIGWTDGQKVGEVEAMALGKLRSEKPAYVEGIIQSLGRVWCPIKGTRCKPVGENILLFTFMEASGKWKALHERPWMVGNDLLVMEEYDPEKTLDEYTFSSIPIWVRVLKLPLGSMNRDNAELIGNRIGEFLEAEVNDAGMAVGEYLKIKVRMEINKPLMRGTTAEVGSRGETRWCPFEYEHLPEFCFTCGIIGHDDKCCSISLAKGEQQQYGKWLKAYMPRKKFEIEKPRWTDGRGNNNDWRNSSGRFSGSRSGSDSLTWKKDDVPKQSVDSGGSNLGKSTSNEEVNSPVKTNQEKLLQGKQKKKLSFSDKAAPEGESDGRTSVGTLALVYCP
ncbi:unnamed protein product [Alopecurus aequalis]